MTYETTKQFADWLKEVRPEFEIKSPFFYGESEVHELRIYAELEINWIYSEYPTSWQPKVLAPCINLEILHDILWELFDVENEMYSIKEEIAYEGTFDLEHGNKKAFQKWIEYTSGKDSLWKTNPDEVLKDIMKTYKELN